MGDTKSGDLSDLMPAVKADVSKYLAIIDIGQFFQKIQVAATNAINWNETLPDGTNLCGPNHVGAWCRSAIPTTISPSILTKP